MTGSGGNKSLRDYPFTFTTEFLVLLAGVLIYRIAADFLGKEGFSEYAVSRRTISFIQPVLMLGLGVGIPRYAAFSSVDKTYPDAPSFLFSGLFIVLAVSAPLLLLANLFSGPVSYLVFGDLSFRYFVPYLSVMLVGIVLHSTCYAYFRGCMQMMRANVMQMLNLSVVPLAVFWLSDTLEGVLLLTGLGWMAVSLFFLIPVLMRNRWIGSDLRRCGRLLLIYGIRRVPGDVALGGFLALPVYFTAHMISDGLITAGYVAFGISLLSMAGAAFAPVCLLLLPQASKAIAAGEFHRIGKYTNTLVLWTLGLTISGIAVVEFFAEPLIALYLGAEFSDLVFCVRLILPAGIGYTLYISLRSILDAYYLKAVNTKNILIAFLAFGVASGVSFLTSGSYVHVLVGFVGGMFLLGMLTYREVGNILHNHTQNMDSEK